MELASLKMTAKDMKADEKMDAQEGYYPCLYLDEKHIKALGLTGARVGDELTLLAKARVSSLSESKGGGSHISLELLEGTTTPASNPETVLYGKS